MIIEISKRQYEILIEVLSTLTNLNEYDKKEIEKLEQYLTNLPFIESFKNRLKEIENQLIDLEEKKKYDNSYSLVQIERKLVAEYIEIEDKLKKIT